MAGHVIRLPFALNSRNSNTKMCWFHLSIKLVFLNSDRRRFTQLAANVALLKGDALMQLLAMMQRAVQESHVWRFMVSRDFTVALQQNKEQHFGRNSYRRISLRVKNVQSYSVREREHRLACLQEAQLLRALCESDIITRHMSDKWLCVCVCVCAVHCNLLWRWVRGTWSAAG